MAESPIRTYKATIYETEDGLQFTTEREAMVHCANRYLHDTLISELQEHMQLSEIDVVRQWFAGELDDRIKMPIEVMRGYWLRAGICRQCLKSNNPETRHNNGLCISCDAPFA